MREPSLHDETWILLPGASPGGTLELDEGETRHLLKVLRLEPGQECRVADGDGHLFSAHLRDGSGRRAVLEIGSLLETRPRPALSLAQAILKNRGLEDVLELCGQLPLDRLQPLWTDHVQIPRGRDLDHQIERLRAKAVASVQQSLQPWLPRILPPMRLDEWLSSLPRDQEPCWICDPGGEDLRTPLSGWVVVGPEGGFSPRELALAEACGSRKLSLGPSRLRAVAAGFAALSRVGP